MIESPVIPDVLIHVEDARAAGASDRAIRAACSKGELVRVRRGTYCPTSVWEDLDERERHVLSIRAVLRRVSGDVLVAGPSAAALWGLPFAARGGDDVTLLVPYPGGGSSEPGVRRTCVSYPAAEGTALDGIPVTTLARTTLDLATRLPFGRAVAIADFVQSRRRTDPLARLLLVDELDRARYARGAAFLRRVVEFSTHLSDSIGESEGRAAIHLAGFETPELQRRWHDDEGDMESDYFWERVNLAGEFDGKVKYTRQEFSGGDPAAVVWREKRREDRLRRLAAGVVRLVYDDIRDPMTLTRILSGAGVPRVRAH